MNCLGAWRMYLSLCLINPSTYQKHPLQGVHECLGFFLMFMNVTLAYMDLRKLTKIMPWWNKITTAYFAMKLYHATLRFPLSDFLNLPYVHPEDRTRAICVHWNPIFPDSLSHSEREEHQGRQAKCAHPICAKRRRMVRWPLEWGARFTSLRTPPNVLEGVWGLGQRRLGCASDILSLMQALIVSINPLHTCLWDERWAI